MMKRIILVMTGLASALSVPALAQNGLADMLGKADLNHDGAVSRDEMIRFRASTFQRMDVNGDGFVASDDVDKWGYLLGNAAAQARWKQLQTTSDANKDKRVSRAEFVKGPTPIFDAADTNHDNILSAAELSARVPH
jgi:Ca2+-binding EF-hand superfamily protein